MEITLEKIELVKDRTGVTYKEAKDALEKAEGNVVDAIIAIEENVDEQSSSRKLGEQGEALVGKMKEVIKKGNIAKIIVKRNDDVLINIPLNAGVLGAVVAPWGIVIGVLAAFSFKCKIELVKDDGSIIDITDKAGNMYEDAVTKGGEIYGGIKDKAPGMYESVREKSEDAVSKARNMAKDAKDAAFDAAGKMKKKSDDEGIIDIDICDKDCESCTEPCEDRCDDCRYDEFHPEETKKTEE
jgi:hypothetical protein